MTNTIEGVMHMETMKKLAVLAAVIGALAAIQTCSLKNAKAHGCDAYNSCSQNSPIVNNDPSVTANVQPTITTNNHQHQQQDQNSQSGAQAAGTGGNVNTNSRYLSVRPVTVQATPIITPAANVSRYAGGECGPRMKILRKAVHGLNNRPMSVQEFEAGEDQTLYPDEVPYKRITVIEGLDHIIGHRVIETTAVQTVSTGGGFGFGLKSNQGAGGWAGVQSAGGVQRMVTTIRLVDCVLMEVDTRNLKPRG